MRWACVLLPHLALDGALRAGGPDDAPFALVDGPAQRRVLHDACDRARALGLKPGQPLGVAQALAGRLQVRPRDVREEARQRDLLAAWAYGFSSQVAAFGPRALAVEVGGSRALFGGWEEIAPRWREELAALGFRHRLALAPNPLAARVLAGIEDDAQVADDAALRARLDALPLARSGLPEPMVQALARMGLRQLGALRALPRSALMRRFPPRLLEHLDALYGEREIALPLYRPPPRFAARVELSHRVESSQALLFPLRRLTGDLALYLGARDGGAQRFELVLEHEDHPATRVPVGLLAPEREAGLLFELARGRLERAAVPAPVEALALHAESLPPFAPEHRDLFDPRPQQAVPWEVLRERLRARLGEDAVQGLALRADHRPERASAPGESDAPAPAPTLDAPRPAWLVREAPPLYGAPRVLAGPERIESGWWDCADARRDYYRVLTRDGREAWVYRERGGDGTWHLHGWFA
ncbi:MAG: DNA polymerase Y family protein [Chiayiivirga sp.]|uniref:DNA polymerase Y family protein n=1 Tax=Denitratimonas tolerans TaxID=1338420 RepID=A0AAW9R141_9GAMM|nr:DNA polymerase Y family protein [Chiayiivirga sp.]